MNEIVLKEFIKKIVTNFSIKWIEKHFNLCKIDSCRASGNNFKEYWNFLKNYFKLFLMDIRNV